jgi:hypothetical protein
MKYIHSEVATQMTMESKAARCPPVNRQVLTTALRRMIGRALLLAALVLATYPAWRWADILNDGDVDWRSWCGSAPAAGKKPQQNISPAQAGMVSPGSDRQP